jgi:hypothetical protein
MIVALFTAGFAQNIELLGAGATFPYPLYSKMFDVYNKQYKIQVNYQSIGSGGGIRQLTNQTVDFGASDAFMSDKDLKGLKNPILHIPICLGSVVISYNLPGNPQIKLTPSILADIYLSKIKNGIVRRFRQLTKTSNYRIRILLLFIARMAVAPPLFLLISSQKFQKSGKKRSGLKNR